MEVDKDRDGEKEEEMEKGTGEEVDETMKE